MFDNRNYLIFNTSEVNKVDFDQVLETSDETLRYSVDGSKTFIKWEDAPPNFLVDLSYIEGPFTHEEILAVLATEEWTNTSEEM